MEVEERTSVVPGELEISLLLLLDRNILVFEGKKTSRSFRS